jgi:hypothetical protein
MIIINAKPNQIDVIVDKSISTSVDITNQYPLAVQTEVGAIIKIIQPKQIDIEYIYRNKAMFKKTHNIESLINILIRDRKVHDATMGEDCEQGCHVDLEDTWAYLVNKMLDGGISRLWSTGITLQKEERVKGKECPVLQEPLKVNAMMFKKCGHFISHEAYQKLVSVNGIKKCPLCRAEHSYQDME